MLIILPVTIFVVINIVLFSVLIVGVKRFSLRAIVIFFMLVIIESLFFAIYTLVSFGGAFGPGVLLFFVSALITLIIFISSIIAGFVLIPQLDKQRRAFYIIGAILMISSVVSPILGITGIGRYCDNQTRKHGDKIVAAIRAYKSNTGGYPERMDALTRDYFKDETSYNCMKGLGIIHEQFTVRFRIQQCEEHPSLVTRSTDGVRVVWYDLETSEWTSISFLDSSCY